MRELFDILCATGEGFTLRERVTAMLAVSAAVGAALLAGV